MSTLRTFFDIDGDMDWVVVDTNASIVNNKGYIVDTTAGAITLILPATPTEGSVIGIKDLNGNFSTNNLTIQRNGNLINGLAQNKVISLDGYGGEFIYSGAAQGWVLYSESDDSIQPHIVSTDNPHDTTKDQVGLGNVDNTSDADKPVSDATQDALDLKADVGSSITSVSGTAPIVSSGGSTPAISINAATTSLPGSMSAADKTKLDGIETAATADMTANEILTAILTVDSAGSGLDADLLDGNEASFFQPLLAFTPENAANKNATNGYAGLSGGKINTNQLPAIAITDTFVVGSQVDMLALTCEIGDVAIRTDLNKCFILQVTGPTVLANWQELLSPTDGVATVTGTAPIVSSGGTSPSISINAATTSTAGSMSSADKTKLDGIEAGAGADMTASEILTAIKTVDGSASGLDADLLDGHDASYFQTALGFTPENTSNKNQTEGYVGLTGGFMNYVNLPPATASHPGAMSASDFSKLDGIEAGATADMTANEILTAIKTVDGITSGLDSDLLDGLNSAQFLRSDVNNSGNLYLAPTDGVGITYWGIANVGLFGSWMSVATNSNYGGRIAGDTTSDYNMYNRMAGGSNRGFVFETSYGYKIFSINPSNVISNAGMLIAGNVGIGTLTPAEKLDVAGKVTSLDGYNTGDYDIVYNSTTQSLDFNFIG
jgi:hypothetical protein